MGVEIERKFLVNKEKWEKVCPAEYKDIVQGYLLNQADRSVRVRIKGTQGFITIKGGKEGISRSEYEYPIPKEEALKLLSEFCPKRIEKRRFEIDFKGFLWEVDEFVFPKRGLILAEIELNEEGQSFSIPNWVEEEVTGQTEYYNSNMLQ